MAISQKKKISNAKWDKENMSVLACKVRKEFADEFKAACAASGTTSNAVLKQAAEDFLKDYAEGYEDAGLPAGDETA